MILCETRRSGVRYEVPGFTPDRVFEAGALRWRSIIDGDLPDFRDAVRGDQADDERAVERGRQGTATILQACIGRSAGCAFEDAIDVSSAAPVLVNPMSSVGEMPPQVTK